MCMFVILVTDVFKYFKCFDLFLAIYLGKLSCVVLHYDKRYINFFTSSEMEMCFVCLPQLYI